jgi:RNA polymerase sigma factor (TIGR02999 family)
LEGDISSLIICAERGDRQAANALFAALYEELNRLARHELARQGGGVTLGATTLLHEAYLNMSGRNGVKFPDRGRFMAYASRVMRGLIIDYARQRKALRRGGHFEITALGDDAQNANDQEFANSKELERIGDALEELSTVDPSLAQVVNLKFFCGFSFQEIAGLSGISERTVRRQWEKARIYLHRSLRESHVFDKR